MTEETVSATTTISTPAETVFAVLADPSRHTAIDGTAWVRDSPDGQRLTGSGQIFRMAMYHPNHRFAQSSHPLTIYRSHSTVNLVRITRKMAWRDLGSDARPPPRASLTFRRGGCGATHQAACG
jgi:uncharacterized protein YndB with AHSA1/START domain